MTEVLVIGVKKPKAWHFETAAGQSAFVSHGAVQYCSWPMITVWPWLQVEGSVEAVPGGLPVVGAPRQYFSRRSSVVLEKRTQICPERHDGSPVQRLAQSPNLVLLMVDPRHKNEASLQSASAVQSAVQAASDDAQMPVEHAGLGERVPVQAAPIGEPDGSGEPQ
jgi:hypothetical protein